jgi:hypothetical protein
MGSSSRLLVASSVFSLLGCGGPALPLVSGSATGSYDGTAFTAVNGFATDREGKSSLIIVGEGNLNCASVTANEPPNGYNGAISVAALAVGDNSNVQVQVYKNVADDFQAVGSNAGTLSITAADDSKVAATIAYTATVSGKALELNGTFEVTRCK